MYARIENSDLSPHYLAPAIKDGKPVGEAIEIPAATQHGANREPGCLPLPTKADADRVLARLGAAVSDDGKRVLRLVRL